MTPEQFELLLKTLKALTSSLASKPYTLTGAADWPILAAMALLMVGMVGFMWTDLKATIKDKDNDLKADLEREIQDRKDQDNHLWTAMRDCKNDCCVDSGGRKDKR